jgi:hypothetical protein
LVYATAEELDVVPVIDAKAGPAVPAGCDIMVERAAGTQVIRPVYGCAGSDERDVGQKDAFEVILGAPVCYRAIGIYKDSEIYVVQIEELRRDCELLDH